MFKGFEAFKLAWWQVGIGITVLGGSLLLGFAYDWVLAIAVIIAGLGWGAALVFRQRSKAFAEKARQAEADQQAAALAVQDRLLKAESRLSEEERRLATLMRLNRGLSAAQDEREIMDTALSALTGLVGALGCSFVPVDEWDQPLPAFTFGQLPEPVLNAWATHLASSYLRHRCANCKLLVGPPGDCPVHPAEVGDAMRVYCLPLTRVQEGNRTLGILHLYLPPGRSLDSSTRGFMEVLLQQLAMAYESARLRTQELGTLRQIQMLHAPEGDFSDSLGALLDGLKQVLEADCVLVRLRPSGDERLSNLNVLRGDLCGMPEEEIDAIFTRVVAGEVARLGKGTTSSEPGALPVWVALPLVLPEGLRWEGTLPAGHVLGMLIAGVSHPHEFHPRQQTVLQTVAAQVALLVENERLIRSLEYKVVIQERARLAREIHDGLAQTLAFLKLQAAQMQSYLAQGDFSRLSQVLKDNYQVLTDAYLDTRQAIDNLRLTPKEGLGAWLERILHEFQHATGITVERSIQDLSYELTPEVQAQLIRIVQEALSNVRKHARARNLVLSVRDWQADLVLEVSDDGLGFDADDVPEVSRHGLRGMRERAEMIGADFQIISQARQGTTVRLVLPKSLEEERSA